MSMMGSYRRISAGTLQRLRQNPGEIEPFLMSPILARFGGAFPIPKEFLSVVDHLPEELRRIALAKMESVRTMVAEFKPPASASGLPADSEPPPLDIEKAWHGLHFVLCGVAEEAPPPLGNAVLGGEPLGGDMGYGPCRFLTPEQVSETAQALSGLSVEEFRRRYDAAALDRADIYPRRWGTGPHELDWLADAFVEVSGYFRDAAAAGEAMLLYLT